MTDRIYVYEFECLSCGRIEVRQQVGSTPMSPRCPCGPWMCFGGSVFAAAKTDRDSKRRVKR